MGEIRLRKITTSGKYSKVIVIPKEFLRTLRWRENQSVEIELDQQKKQLIIKDAKNK